MTFLRQQIGNVLVLILLATGLFAFLSYSLLKSGSDANMGSVSNKDMDIAIQEMVRYGTGIENAVSQMVLMNNVSPSEISFESSNDSPATLHENTNCTGNICQVFDISGGGITWREPPAEVAETSSTPYLFSGASSIYGHGSDGAAAENGDLFLSVSVTENACVAIGDFVDVPFDDATGPEDSFINTAFTGTYASTSGQEIDHADLTGEKTFCFKNTADGKYYFVYVLYAR